MKGQRSRVGHCPTFHFLTQSILTQPKQMGKPATAICPVWFYINDPSEDIVPQSTLLNKYESRVSPALQEHQT